MLIHDLYSKVICRLLETQMNTEPLTSGCVKKQVVKYLCYSLTRKSGKKKLKLFPCFHHEGGRRCTTPLILKHCYRWRRMVNITLRPLFYPRNNPGMYWTGEDAELFIQKYALLCDLNFVPVRQRLQGADRLDSNLSDSDRRFHRCFVLKLVLLWRIKKQDWTFKDFIACVKEIRQISQTVLRGEVYLKETHIHCRMTLIVKIMTLFYLYKLGL